MDLHVVAVGEAVVEDDVPSFAADETRITAKTKRRGIRAREGAEPLARRSIARVVAAVQALTGQIARNGVAPPAARRSRARPKKAHSGFCARWARSRWPCHSNTAPPVTKMAAAAAAAATIAASSRKTRARRMAR